MGKRFRITAWFTEDAAANGYLATHKNEGVIACTHDGLILIAELNSGRAARGPDRREPAGDFPPK